jgi:hypothetical protein
MEASHSKKVRETYLKEQGVVVPIYNLSYEAGIGRKISV